MTYTCSTCADSGTVRYIKPELCESTTLTSQRPSTETIHTRFCLCARGRHLRDKANLAKGTCSCNSTGVVQVFDFDHTYSEYCVCPRGQAERRDAAKRVAAVILGAKPLVRLLRGK